MMTNEDNPVLMDSAVTLKRKAPASSSRLEPWMLLVSLGIAEVTSDLWRPGLGIWMHVALAAWLLWRGAQSLGTPRGRFYVAAAAMPMVRIISFTISPHLVPGVWYYATAEFPLMLMALIGTRSLDLPLTKTLGMVRPRGWVVTALVFISGPVIGWGEAHILHAPVLSASGAPAAMILPGLLLVIFTGFSEEWLFRGLIQTTAMNWLGPVGGLIFTIFGWSLLHIGWNSWIDVAYVSSVGVFWGWARNRTGSTWATALAHGLANVVLFCVLPWHPGLYFIPTLWGGPR